MATRSHQAREESEMTWLEFADKHADGLGVLLLVIFFFISYVVVQVWGEK
jgi:hypothetical protein